MGLFDFLKKNTKLVNNKYVFDKAKYHDDSIVNLGLDEEQSFVHTGLFLAWLVNNEMMSEFFIKEGGDDIDMLKTRRISPSTIYMNWDEVLIGEMLSNKGFHFAMAYFDFEKGAYMIDYEKVFDVKGEKVFTVKDTWNNYDKISLVIDAAYKSWNN